MSSGRKKIAEKGNALAGLRAPGIGPDPRFRAVLRTRLVTAAAARGENRRGEGRHGEECRNHGRDPGRGGSAD
ncbi:hypothetical protein [Actinomadura fibrosa]|uniref:Uncharacterized protein n=1 Tax=Actinomadura fibrosa TaxID=111802 RepID=A0ABW2XHN7_9ACTN|nr:hypothetical protein [Actinomadura fibrosa]